MGVSVKRVLRYLRSDRCPDWNTGRKTRTGLDPFAEHIGAWVGRSGRNAAELYRDLVGLGYRGSYDAVRRYLARRLGSIGRPEPRVGVLVPVAAPAPPSARKLSYEFIRRPEEREAEEQARFETVRACETTLGEGLDLAGEFAEMVRRLIGDNHPFTSTTIRFPAPSSLPGEPLSARPTCVCGALRSGAQRSAAQWSAAQQGPTHAQPPISPFAPRSHSGSLAFFACSRR
jgi:hypothetical protein